MKVNGSQEKLVEFSLYAPQARLVILAGTFNDWDTIRMQKCTDGEWQTQLHIAPGRYEYQFMVDGLWVNDRHAAESIRHPSGRLVSVLVVFRT